MLNAIWVFMILAAITCGAATGKIEAVTKASIESAEAAVKIALGLIGVMAFWIGMMRILERGGFLPILARAVRPIMKRLFPEVPANHPAMSMMLLNISANMLGLSNAATPFGLKAMTELDKLNPRKGVATNSMALFLAINTAGIVFIPTSILAVRASLNAQQPASIVVPTILASFIGTVVAVITALALQNLKFFRGVKSDVVGETTAVFDEDIEYVIEKPNPKKRDFILGIGCFILLFAAVWYGTYGKRLSEILIEWPLLIMLGLIVSFGVYKGVKVYDAVVEGGKEAFGVAVKIIPFLVAMLVAVGMLRASGAIDMFTVWFSPVTSLVGMPSEVLPMALLRPLTGSGGLAVAGDIMKAHGPDSLAGNIVSVMQNSSETTFYVLAVYFGSVGIRAGRHTLAACLIADVAATLATVWVCRWFF